MLMTLRDSFAAFVVVGLALSGHAQGPVAPKAGLIYFAEGTVLLDGQPLDAALSQVLFVEQGKAISTKAGRAEVWLGPSNYLRLSEHTVVRLHSTDLSDVQITLESGVILMEIREVSRDSQITLRGVSSNVSVSRRGLYRMEQGPTARLKVFDGRAQVADREGADVVKKGWMIDLSASAASEPKKFQRKLRDGFDHWSADRSAYLAEMELTEPQEDSTTLGGGLHPMYVPRTSPTKTANPFPEEGVR